MRNIFVILTISLFFQCQLFGQTQNAEYAQVDAYVKSLGKLDSMNAGTISQILTRRFSDNEQKVRAIFDWIAYNIDYDCKEGKKLTTEVIPTDEILKKRKATASGYSALFQDMCSVANIRCLTVDGYAKTKADQLLEKPETFNHTWVVVQLGNSPDTWHYVDPTWGSGFTDEKMTTYTRKINDAYFFANKRIFNLQHYPNNQAWLLGNGAKNLKDFFSLPIVKDAAYDLSLRSFLPLTGIVKGKINQSTEFQLSVSVDYQVDLVEIEYGFEKKPVKKTVDYKINNGNIGFYFKLEEENAFLLKILINHNPVLGYWMDIKE